MTVVQPFSESTPRHPCHEVAHLLATSILRMRAGHIAHSAAPFSAVQLDKFCHQSVHANPDQQEGVCP